VDCRVKPTLVVAVTGGIASGKTTVCDAFARLGRVVIDADLIARELVCPGQPALDEIVAAFGAGVLTEDGALDRAAMRSQVFADVPKRRQLEAILHPRIRALMKARAEAADGPYVILAIPLLTESGTYAWVDRVVVVDLPESLQIARLRRRDGADLAAARAVLAAQSPRRTRLVLAQDVIINDGPPEAADAVVARLDRLYRGMAESRIAPTAPTRSA